VFGVRGPPRPPGSPLAARDPPCRQAANPPCKDPRPTSNFLPPVAFHSLPEYDRQPAHITANPYGNSARRHFTTDKLRFLLPLFRGSRDCERTSRGIAYGISPTRNTVIWQEPYKEPGEPEHEASIAAATLPYTNSVEHRLVPYNARVQTRMGGNWLCAQILDQDGNLEVVAVTTRQTTNLEVKTSRKSTRDCKDSATAVYTAHSFEEKAFKKPTIRSSAHSPAADPNCTCRFRLLGPGSIDRSAGHSKPRQLCAPRILLQ